MSALRQIEADAIWTVAALDYELGYLLEPRARPQGWEPGRKVVARFWRFQHRVEMRDADVQAWLADHAGQGAGGIGGVQPSIGESDYCSAVERIQQFIRDGDCYQVNFTFPIEFSWFGSPAKVYEALRQRQPVRYGGFVGNRQAGIVSLSPELFLERQGERLLTRPMKGTAARTEASETLRQSVKDRAENLMIVDLLRNDLGKLAEPGSVRVERLFDIEAYPTVWQMVSEVSAKIGRQSIKSVLEALFPCGSITGAPKIRAMQIIGDLETTARGLYTGALGWFAPNGDFRLNVAIRTLVLDGDQRGRMGVGSGIVADSRSDAEWQECLLKAAFVRAGGAGLKLIETLRRENGVYPMWEGHLARLRHSAAWFGFPLDEQRLCRELGRQPTKGLWRVRLTLDASGDVEVVAAELSGESPGERLAELSDVRIDSRNPLRAHKTTERHEYDAALKGLAADSPVFDRVFLNERGEIVEGARSNVFVERDGVLLTPPVNCGALPGVLRAGLLAAGKAREAVLYPEDLADGFWLGNALRGLVRVRLSAR